MDLGNKKCKPCEGDVPPMDKKDIEKYLKEINNEWRVVDDKKISREFKLVNFKHAMDFVRKVADLAEDEGHHPDIHIFYSRVVIELSTHAINGLSENDFILAYKIDQL